MQLVELIATLEAIAPLRHAEPWDNVGLLAGDPQQPVARVLLTIDYTAAVADEGRDERCDLVIAYHPPLFSAVKRVTGDGATALLHDAIRRGVAIYSPHTALDAADGGTNDVLADAVGLATCRPLRVGAGEATFHKLVTFVPPESADAVAFALAAAGAGRIGKYSGCSFRSAGTGTFTGDADTNPTIGTPGVPTVVPEVRLEMACPVSAVRAVTAALLRAHPYEEPAYEFLTVAAPLPQVGAGRVGWLASPQSGTAIVERVKQELSLDGLLIAGNLDRPIATAAVCAGAGGDLLGDAIAAGVELYLTGELRHHDALRAVAAGMTVLCTLHSNSERPALSRLRDRLEREAPGPAYLLSQADRDPFAIR
jgi:dinuclear metal center YbgI/SA1388 family protein